MIDIFFRSFVAEITSLAIKLILEELRQISAPKYSGQLPASSSLSQYTQKIKAVNQRRITNAM